MAIKSVDFYSFSIDWWHFNQLAYRQSTKKDNRSFLIFLCYFLFLSCRFVFRLVEWTWWEMATQATSQVWGPQWCTAGDLSQINCLAKLLSHRRLLCFPKMCGKETKDRRNYHSPSPSNRQKPVQLFLSMTLSLTIRKNIFSKSFIFVSI